MSWIRGRGKAAAAEPRGFTDLVRSIAEGRPLDEKSFRAMWSELGAVLRAELKRRGLWESPPAYLGVFGWGSWEEAAFDELLAECYTYVFVDRLRGLKAQLKLKPNIEGLVSLSVRHFVHERQKENDPIGSQVFEVLQSAVRKAVEERELEVVSGDKKIRNDTVLAFRPSEVSAGVPVRDREKLAVLAAAWNDALLPDLVTLRGQKQEEVVQRLRERLGDLRAEGVEVFRFKDLVDPLKADVRARWAALLDRAQGEPAPGESPGEVVRLVPPDTRVEERQVFRKLVNCVLTGIRRLDASEKTRGYLLTLWQFLRVQAEGTPSSFDSSLVAEMEDELPSQRKLAEQLRIPRERLPGLYETLRDLLAKCQAAISGKTAVISLEQRSILRESASRDRRSRHDDH